MARHRLALDLSLLTKVELSTYHMKYSVLDCEISTTFHTRAEHES